MRCTLVNDPSFILWCKAREEGAKKQATAGVVKTKTKTNCRRRLSRSCLNRYSLSTVGALF